MSKHRILFLDFLVLLSIFFLAKIFLPLPWISDSRRLSRRIHNASASWKKGPKSPVNSSSLVLLCPPSSLYDLSPPSNGLVYMSIFLPSWHFSHFPKIEFRWPFSLFTPLASSSLGMHTQKSSVPPNISPRGSNVVTQLMALSPSKFLFYVLHCFHYSPSLYAYARYGKTKCRFF